MQAVVVAEREVVLDEAVKEKEENIQTTGADGRRGTTLLHPWIR
jgi:hypothetical protein